MGEQGQPEREISRWFATTHWSIVLNAASEDSREAAAALEKLCRMYWPPLFGYIRRLGRTHEEAQDLTQEFFAQLLEANVIQSAKRERGRFRTFLLTSLQHFLVKDWEKERAAKRGGGRANFVSLDALPSEGKYGSAPGDKRTAEEVFEHRWALTVLEQTLGQLQAECAVAGKSMLLEDLKDYIWGAKNGASYAEIGTSLGMTEGAVKVAMHRLRRRFRELLRAEVAQTVAKSEDIDEELRYLIRVLAR